MKQKKSQKTVTKRNSIFPQRKLSSFSSEQVVFAVMTSLVIVFLIGAAYILGTKKSTLSSREMIPVSQETQLNTKVSVEEKEENNPSDQTTTLTSSSSQAEPSKVMKKTTVPQDWKKYTATDTDFGISTTLSLPSNFEFRFTGSETMILDNLHAEEYWDYKTSIFRSGEDVTNHYKGESRRLWFEKYVNGEFLPSNQRAMGSGTAQILSVQEYPYDTSSYLKITYKGGMNRLTAEEHVTYLFVQNGIVHMFEPVSAKAKSSNSEISPVIGTILTSLTSKQVK